MQFGGCSSRGRCARGARGGAAAALFSPATPARAPLGKRGLAASPARPPLAPPPSRGAPGLGGGRAVRASPLGPGPTRARRAAPGPSQTRPRRAGGRTGPSPATTPPSSSAPGTAQPLPPPIRGDGRAAAESYFGTGWEDVTAETRAAPGTGAGAGRPSFWAPGGRADGEASGRPTLSAPGSQGRGKGNGLLPAP